jgi:hypothetical protein
LENCRVLVTNVDTQASINGGILIQVLGEMSNRNEVARKFAQTFFLVEQQNGQLNCYYVLNDIIRFLSDDDIEIYSGEDGAGTSTSPTGTLVEEPINVSSSRIVQVGPSNSAQNTTITESAQVTLRVMDANIPIPSSKENEIHLRTEEVVDPVVDNDGMHAQPLPSSALNTNVQPILNRPSLSPTAQNHNGQTVNMNKQESITTLTDSVSQDAANGQALSMQSIQAYPSGSQPTPVISTNSTSSTSIHQLPAVVSNQESITISTSIESQSLQMLKASLLQGNNGQSKTVNVVTNSSTSPVEQDKQSVVKTSKQVSAQSLMVNSSQGVGKDPSTQNNITSLTSETQSPVMQSKAGQPANFPAVSTTHSQASSQPPILATNSNFQASSISKLHPVPNNDTQLQAVNTLHANNQSPKSMMDNNSIQLSSSKQKLSFAVQDGQTTNVMPIIGSQVSQPGSPGVGIHSQIPNNEVNQINNTTQTDKKDNVPKNGMSDPQKLSDNNYASQLQVPIKKTWASLAANEPEKWSSNALAEAKGVVASVPAKTVALQSQSQQMRDNRDRRSEGQKNNGHRNSGKKF